VLQLDRYRAELDRRLRPTVLERAWNSLETSQFGTNEFVEWCRLVGREPYF
jgi:alpha-N-arabinofuranosidase